MKKETKAEQNARHQREFRVRQREKNGIVRIRVNVPTWSIEQVNEFCRHLRESSGSVR